jgi:hypothetical protein
VAVGIRFVVADIAVEQGGRAGVDQAHPVEPVGQRTARALDAGDVAMHHQAVGAAGQVLRIVPVLFEFLGFLGFLAVGRAGVGIAAVGADQAVDHQLQHGRRLVPVVGVRMMTPWAATHFS